MRRKQDRVLFVPDWRAGNPYMESLSRGLDREGFQVVFDHFPDGYFKLTRLANAHPSVGVIHVHWIVSFLEEFFWSRNAFKFGTRLVLLTLDVLLCRARGIRIIWTLHNIIEHESRSPDQELRVRALLARTANAVIAHSKEGLDAAAARYRIDLSRNGHVIPHGSYVEWYQYDETIRESLKQKYGIKDGERVILFFGSLRQYKGLDLLLSAFRSISDSRRRLIVAGKPLNDEIGQWLVQEAGKDDRVCLCIGFVPEEQVAAHFALADAVVLPLQNALTSGSTILAMGFGKCLILPDSARVFGIPGDAGALYYKDETGLTALLAKLPELDLEAMGKHNLETARRLDWRKIAVATASVYSGDGRRVVWEPGGPAPKD